MAKIKNKSMIERAFNEKIKSYKIQYNVSRETKDGK